MHGAAGVWLGSLSRAAAGHAGAERALREQMFERGLW
jgi:hypothetical protein